MSKFSLSAYKDIDMLFFLEYEITKINIASRKKFGIVGSQATDTFKSKGCNYISVIYI